MHACTLLVIRVTQLDRTRVPAAPPHQGKSSRFVQLESGKSPAGRGKLTCPTGGEELSSHVTAGRPARTHSRGKGK
jgi:hypothetical protein